MLFWKYMCGCCPCSRKELRKDRNGCEGSSSQSSYGSVDQTGTGNVDNKQPVSAMQYHYQHRMSLEKEKQSLGMSQSGEGYDGSSQVVYECAGLALTGEFEISNPMFIGKAKPSIGRAKENKEDN